MNYYEKLVKKIDQSMKLHPRSAMVIDMDTFASLFRIIAKGPNLAAVNKKRPAKRRGTPSYFKSQTTRLPESSSQSCP
jgi:hypothetical protein